MAVYRTSLVVRFRDLDAMGHVNNATYLTYLEEARVRFWDHLASMHRELDPHRFPFVIARAEVDFVRPLFLGDRVWVDLWVSRIGRSSFEFAYRLYNTHMEEVARARTVQVHVTGEGSTPLPDFMRRALEVYLERDPALDLA